MPLLVFATQPLETASPLSSQATASRRSGRTVREDGSCFNDQRIAWCPVVAVHASTAGCQPDHGGPSAVAVVFDLVDPVRTGRERAREGKAR